MASANDTIITPGSGSITDASGNVFTVTNAGTVDMNGAPLGYTANVLKAVYFTGGYAEPEGFWQQNSSGLWWEYTGNPAAPWTGLGTSTSPLPAGPITPSANITITPGAGSIIDSSGNVYTVTAAGTVDMNDSPLGYTANVIDAAYVNGTIWQENSAHLWWEYTGNPAAPWTGLGTSASPLAVPITLPFGASSGALSGTAYTITGSGTEYTGNPELNASLDLTNPQVSANISIYGGIGVADAYYNSSFPANLTIDFANQLTTSSIAAHTGDLTLNGPQLVNEGDIGLIASTAQINSDVVGVGNWNLDDTNLTVNGAVGAGQVFDFVNVPGSVTIDDPHSFQDLLDVTSNNGFGSVTLSDLTATSYSWANNVLMLYNGNNPVDQLRFADTSSFYVSQSAGGILISGAKPPTILPIHSSVV